MGTLLALLGKKIQFPFRGVKFAHGNIISIKPEGYRRYTKKQKTQSECIQQQQTHVDSQRVFGLEVTLEDTDTLLVYSLEIHS